MQTDYLRNEQPIYYIHNDKADKNPVFIQPGFAANLLTLKDFSHALYQQGLNVIVNPHAKNESKQELKIRLAEAKKKAQTLYEPYIQKGKVSEEAVNVAIDQITLSLFDEAEELIQLIEKNCVTSTHPIHLVMHSQGALIGTIAAILRPDLFVTKNDTRSRLILLNPSGFTAMKKIPLRVNYIIELISTALNSDPRMLRVLFDNFRYVLAHTHDGRVFREVHDMTHLDLLPFISLLDEAGIFHVIVVYDSGDRVFSAKTIKERLKDYKGVTLFETSDEGHFGPIRKPERTATIVSEALLH